MNLKYNYRFILCAIVVLMFFGCEKNFLNTKLDTNKTPEAAATDRSTLWSFASAVYSPMNDGFTILDGNLFAAASDEAQQTAVSSNANYFNQGTINANVNPINSLYSNYYEGIRAANFFLDYSENGRKFLALNRDTITDLVNYNKDIQNLAWYRAEAHIARAYYYAELIKMYGGVPIIEKTLQQTTVVNVPKSTYDQVVDYIVSEIDNNKVALQLNWKTSLYADQDGRFSLGSALAIKARVLLYAASPLHNATNDVAKWQKAVSAANDVINTTGLNYILDSTNSYRDYFLGAKPLASNESILAIRRAANNTIEAANYPISTPGGKSGVTPTENLVADYEYIGAIDPADPYKNRDPRLAATIVTNGSAWNNRVIDQSKGGSDDMSKVNTSRTGYYLKKFLTDNINLVQAGTVQNQWVAYRYAEVLLNYAEAMNEAYGPDVAQTGNPLTARQALKKVRDRASILLPVVTAVSKEDFRIAVKHERRIELAFEDHRYWDLLRWKDAETVLNQSVKGVGVSKNTSGVFSYLVSNVATRKFLARNYYFPFAQSEIVNSKGTIVQNDGY